MQGSQLPDSEITKEIKIEKVRERNKILEEKIDRIKQELPIETSKALNDTRLPGASSWLGVLPLEEEYGFCLNKGE